MPQFTPKQLAYLDKVAPRGTPIRELAERFPPFSTIVCNDKMFWIIGYRADRIITVGEMPTPDQVIADYEGMTPYYFDPRELLVEKKH